MQNVVQTIRYRGLDLGEEENMTDSILLTVRKINGAETDNTFDLDLIVNINSVLLDLKQNGVPIPDGYRVEDELSSWSDLNLSGDLLDTVMAYLPMQVKLRFNPPQSSVELQALKDEINKMEWRLMIEAGG